ncbi:MAG: transcription-repair coupling factor [SAR202 cluster bacterium]|nr:transcription-repair coupling factor [SAR202 cluster bacterium]
MFNSLNFRFNLPILYVTRDINRAETLVNDLLMITGSQNQVFYYPPLENIPFEFLHINSMTYTQRSKALSAIIESEKNQYPPIVVAPISAITNKIISSFEMKEKRLIIKEGTSLKMKDFLFLLLQFGYKLNKFTEMEGQCSQRGGIIDIFCPIYEKPIRIEFWGEEVVSLRSFDTNTQTSLEVLNAVTIYPVSEVVFPTNDASIEYFGGQIDHKQDDKNIQQLSRDVKFSNNFEFPDFYAGTYNKSSLLDYFTNTGLVIIDGKEKILEKYFELYEEIVNRQNIYIKTNTLPLDFQSPYFSYTEFNNHIESLNKVIDIKEIQSKGFNVPIKPILSYQNQFDRLISDIKVKIKSGVVIVVSSYLNRIKELFQEYEISYDVLTDQTKGIKKNIVTIVEGNLKDGLVIEQNEEVLILSDNEIFGFSKQRNIIVNENKTRGVSSVSLDEFSINSFVVHIDHGIGKFIGTTVMSEYGDGEEYMVLQYADKGKIYVPTHMSHRVSLYKGSNGSNPSLSRLSTMEWKRTKAQVEKDTLEIAKDLLDLYAQRNLAKGKSFPSDSLWQKELEDSFPYIETEDQIRVINEVKEDMESSTPMDRLICGDVGFGKTEVALRSAFKAVDSGSQVIILVPTTVLATQHFETFVNRLKPYPITVKMLSRLVPKNEQKEIINDLLKGNVDICIGTHRLLQKDIKLKNLGLVIVDEEHRFGVLQKDRLKEMRLGVDYLSMSATPIPRTLSMTMSGLKDMSTIDTAPEYRLPVKTFVSEENDELITEAIKRELSRQGQVYYLHNRVHSIEMIASKLKKLLPNLRVGVAHGRMLPDSLDKVMTDFVARKFDILVCTTIIESGLDLPSVNTLIVDNADRFGLAQLYQLRGRIGRSYRQGYAYFTIPEFKIVTPPAQARLDTILASSDIGSGYRVASRDLEIRGAGQVLGKKQSGHITTIGFDLYMKMISHAMKKVKGQELLNDNNAKPFEDKEQKGPHLKLNLNALIPTEFIPEVSTRISLYNDLAEIDNIGDLYELKSEITDKYGQIPPEFENLFIVARLRLMSFQCGINSIILNENIYHIRFDQTIKSLKYILESNNELDINVKNRSLNCKVSTYSNIDTLDKLFNFIFEIKDRVESIH